MSVLAYLKAVPIYQLPITGTQWGYWCRTFLRYIFDVKMPVLFQIWHSPKKAFQIDHEKSSQKSNLASCKLSFHELPDGHLWKFANNIRQISRVNVQFRPNGTKFWFLIGSQITILANWLGPPKVHRPITFTKSLSISQEPKFEQRVIESLAPWSTTIVALKTGGEHWWMMMLLVTLVPTVILMKMTTSRMIWPIEAHGHCPTFGVILR